MILHLCLVLNLVFYYKFLNTFEQKQFFQRLFFNIFSVFCLQKYSIAQQCVIS